MSERTDPRLPGMRGRSIDLNADLGEGFGRYRLTDDDALMDLVSSANIACGFHAGDPVTMARAVRAAQQRGVAIGAHPAYPDLVGFGRREMDASPEEITTFMLYQIGALAGFCRAAGSRLRYVKPHGALYNRAERDPATAAAIVEGVRKAGLDLILLGLTGGKLIQVAAEAGVPTAAEAFIDRAYLADGTLVPRSRPGAVIEDVAEAVDRAVSLARRQTVTAVDGSSLTIHADSLCLHGDTPDAVARLRAVRSRLEAEGVLIAPFAS
jgi:5-oxoprolinase (ATP-hydrolysing) subunit A